MRHPSHQRRLVGLTERPIEHSDHTHDTQAGSSAITSTPNSAADHAAPSMIWGNGSLSQVLVGGWLLHLIMGTVYTWGSLTVYVTSYLRQYDDKITYDDSIVIYALIILGQALVMTIGGRIELRTGPRVAAALGSLFLIGSTLAAAWIKSLWAMALVFGLCFGAGGGLTYTIPIVCGYRWDSTQKGWISGVVLSGFGASALLFNQVQSAIVNPHNLKPEVVYKNKRYFAAPGPVTDAVPGLFVKLACIYTALAVVGILLLRDPGEYKKIDDALQGGHGANGSGFGAGAASALRRRLYDEEGEEVGGIDEDNDRGAAAAEGDDDAEEDKTPMQLLRTPQAWHVSLAFLLGSLGGLVTLSTYKSYGQTTFVDDHFMSFVVGSVASACNAGGRMLWGCLSDRVGAYRTLRAASLLQSLALCTWGLTINPLHSKWAFAAWVGAVCLCHGGGFAVYPALVADLFGKKESASNFGMVFLGYGIMSLVGLAVLPRLSAALSPLNYFLGLIALFAAINITCLDRCYPAHHLHNGGKLSTRSKARERLTAQSNGNGSLAN